MTIANVDATIIETSGTNSSEGNAAHTVTANFEEGFKMTAHHDKLERIRLTARFSALDKGRLVSAGITSAGAVYRFWCNATESLDHTFG